MGWITRDDSLDPIDHKFPIYLIAFYYMTTTFTTVGYGDWGGIDSAEIWFLMTMELVGLAVFSWIMGSIQSIESQKS